MSVHTGFRVIGIITAAVTVGLMLAGCRAITAFLSDIAPEGMIIMVVRFITSVRAKLAEDLRILTTTVRIIVVVDTAVRVFSTMNRATSAKRKLKLFTANRPLLAVHLPTAVRRTK
jgi:hypothetical protein